MSVSPYSPKGLGDFLQKRIEEKGWSNREAARRAGIGSGTISRLLREEKQPRAETLKALATALDVEETRLLYLAGLLDELPTSDLDQSAAYIARRLTQLPVEIREIAIDALTAQLDAIIRMWTVQKEAEEETKKLLSQLNAIKASQTE